MIGAGPIGLLTASVVKASGATAVFVSEQDPRRRERIQAFGMEPLTPEAVPAGSFDVVLSARRALPRCAQHFLPFERMALSCQEGKTKANPAFFLLLIEQLGVRPEECVYVGDGMNPGPLVTGVAWQKRPPLEVVLPGRREERLARGSTPSVLPWENASAALFNTCHMLLVQKGRSGQARGRHSLLQAREVVGMAEAEVR